MNHDQDIIWISLESTGAKHTSLNNSLNTTPRILRLAEEYDGIVFDQCFSSSMWTPPSTASILTGTHMSTHNIGFNGHGRRSVPDGLATIPELLQQKGYETMCVSPNPYISSITGLDRGFDDFYHFSKTTLWKRAHPADLLGYLRRIRSIGPGMDFDYRKHNLSWFLINRAKRWFDNISGPRFIYAHIGNPHHPYCPPLKFRDEFIEQSEGTSNEAIRDSFSIFGSGKMKETIANGNFDEGTLANLKAMYHGEIAYADHLVGGLLPYIFTESPNAIVVVTADHGDAFGEQGVLGHNLILDDVLTHVPAVVFGLDSVANSSEPTGHIDLMKTVMSAVGVESSQFEGRDLRTEVPNYCVSQRGKAHFEDYLEENPQFDTSKYHESPLTAVRTSEYKFLYSKNKNELFKLPDEVVDVSEKYPNQKDNLQEIAKSHHFNSTISMSETNQFNDELSQQLEDLGYL